MSRCREAACPRLLPTLVYGIFVHQCFSVPAYMTGYDEIGSLLAVRRHARLLALETVLGFVTHDSERIRAWSSEAIATHMV